MNSRTTSASTLPNHLASKADPALIAADEQHFAVVAQSLEQSIADLSDRLDAARHARRLRSAGDGAGHVEIHRLTARLRALRRFGLDCSSDTSSAQTTPSPYTSDGLALRTVWVVGC